MMAEEDRPKTAFATKYGVVLSSTPCHLDYAMRQLRFKDSWKES